MTRKRLNMARPERKDADYFPIWKPSGIHAWKIRSHDYKTRLDGLRKSSDRFLRNKDVRKMIFKEGKNRCAFCHSIENLSIDHIVSVYRAAKGEFPIENLNTRGNLQLLCKECNSRKAP